MKLPDVVERYERRNGKFELNNQQSASYTHVAFCTLRLESVWMITGHAAGIAAATAAKNGLAVQQIDVAALQQKLRAQKQVVDFAPGQPEKCAHLNGPPEF